LSGLLTARRRRRRRWTADPRPGGDCVRTGSGQEQRGETAAAVVARQRRRRRRRRLDGSGALSLSCSRHGAGSDSRARAVQTRSVDRASRRVDRAARERDSAFLPEAADERERRRSKNATPSILSCPPPPQKRATQRPATRAMKMIRTNQKRVRARGRRRGLPAARERTRGRGRGAAHTETEERRWRASVASSSPLEEQVMRCAYLRRHFELLAMEKWEIAVRERELVFGFSAPLLPSPPLRPSRKRDSNHSCKHAF